MFTSKGFVKNGKTYASLEDYLADIAEYTSDTMSSRMPETPAAAHIFIDRKHQKDELDMDRPEMMMVSHVSFVDETGKLLLDLTYEKPAMHDEGKEPDSTKAKRITLPSNGYDDPEVRREMQEMIGSLFSQSKTLVAYTVGSVEAIELILSSIDKNTQLTINDGADSSLSEQERIRLREVVSAHNDPIVAARKAKA